MELIGLGLKLTNKEFVEHGYRKAFLTDAKDFTDEEAKEVADFCVHWLRDQKRHYRKWFGDSIEGKVLDLYNSKMSREIIEKYERRRKKNARA